LAPARGISLLRVPVRVLIVDDDDAFRRSAAELLADCGYDVAGEVTTLATARAAVARLDPDALLLDVNLPDGSGVTLATELTDAGARSRVLLTSTDSSALTRRLLARCGAAGFVAKPDLMAVDLREYLG
jgi:DNA-binding NarL/FixJ family response regulator